MDHYVRRCSNPPLSPRLQDRKRKHEYGTHQLACDEPIGKMMKEDSGMGYIFSPEIPHGVNVIEVGNIKMSEPSAVGDEMAIHHDMMEVEIDSHSEFSRKMDEIIAGLENQSRTDMAMQFIKKFEKSLELSDENNNLQYSEEFLLNETENKESDEIYSLVCSISKLNCRERMTLKIDEHDVSMEIDTGAVVSVCSEFYFRKYFMNKELFPVGMPLKVVSGENLQFLGKISVNVKFGEKNHQNLPLVIMKGSSNLSMLIGRNLLDILVPKWRKAFMINAVNDFLNKFLMEIKKKYRTVFQDNIKEPIKEFKVDIRLSDDAVPVVQKPYVVPFSLREKVEKELERLCKENVLQKVDRAKWASPIVVVSKSNGEIRICGNYAVTVHPYIRTDHYEIPIIDDILAKVGGKSYYCVFDLKGAFQQLELSENAKKILGISTHKGLYLYNRMSFGVSEWNFPICYGENT
jgi:hypothetical protein